MTRLNSKINMIKPCISVIVPVYNVEKYLHECVSSLINQTLHNIQIILVDDGSTDNCPRICDEYQEVDSRIEVIHQNNAGSSNARNSGIEIANGEFIAFVDADDFIDTTMYEILYSKAKENNLDTIFCGFKRIFSNKLYSEFKQVNSFIIFENTQEIKHVLLEMVGTEPQFAADYRFEMSTCMGIYSRTIIDNFSVLFPTDRELISEDIFFNIQFLIKSKKVGFVPETFYNYRKNENSQTLSYKADRFIKIKTLYLELIKKLNKIVAPEEFQMRADRAFLGNVRMSVSYEVSNINNTSYKKVKKNLSEVVSDNVLKEVLIRYPYKKLPFFQKIFFLCLKYSLVNTLILISYLNNKRKTKF